MDVFISQAHFFILLYLYNNRKCLSIHNLLRKGSKLRGTFLKCASIAYIQTNKMLTMEVYKHADVIIILY